jgi:hypothetical protein
LCDLMNSKLKRNRGRYNWAVIHAPGAGGPTLTPPAPPE